MSNTTIPNLPVAIALTGNEEVQVVQSNVSVRTTVQDIANLAPNQGTVTQVNTSLPITGGPFTETGTIGLEANGVTNGYLAPMAGYTIKGNATGTSVTAQDLTVTQTLNLLGIGSIPGNTILGNLSGIVGNPTSFTWSQYADTFYGNSQGSILYRNGTQWIALPPGTSGQVLKTNGAGANPSWVTTGTGTVQQINTGTGLTGGPITTTGTISIANTAVSAGTYGTASSVSSFTVNAQGQLTAASNAPISIPASAINTTIPNSGLTNSSLTVNGTSISLGGSGTITANTTATLTFGTGLSGSSFNGSTPVTAAIANTSVTADSYGSASSVATFTVNAQGQLTAASSTPINGIALTTGTISTAPTNATDIANKDYVDSVAAGLNFHQACNYATTAALPSYVYSNGASGVGATITASVNGALTIDGYTFVGGDIGKRILVKNETAGNAPYNGIYTLTQPGSGTIVSGTKFVLTRATDYDSSGTGTNEIDAGDFVLVLSGTTNANTSWVQQTPLPITVGTTAITFIQFGGSGTAYTAGTGLSLVGNVFSIANTAVSAGSYGSASSVPTYTVNAQGQLTAASNTAIAIDASAVTSGTLDTARLSGSYTGITGVGTLTAGTWNATTIASGYGGTGFSTYATGDMIYASGVNTLAKLTAGTNGYLLTMAGGVPTWAAAPATGVTSITFGTTGLTPNTAFTGAVTVAGTLVAANGGTGQSSYTVGDLLYASGTTALSKLADVAVGSVLVSGGVGVAPAYSATPTLTSVTAPTILGGTATSSTLTLQSTSGIGATDSIAMKVGNNGATTALNVATTGIVSFPTTGAVVLPASTTANRPTGQTGMLRFNTTTTAFEGYNGSAWGSIGGGATGGGTDQIFYLNGQTVTTNYSIPSGQNAGTFGPVTINSGATVTVPSGSTWSIV